MENLILIAWLDNKYRKLIENYKNESKEVFKYTNFMTYEEMAKFNFWRIQKSDIKFDSIAHQKYKRNF